MAVVAVVRRRRRLPRWSDVAAHVVLSIGAFLVAFPFLWMLLTSLKTLPESAGFPPTLLPREPQWGNYPAAWAAANFVLAFRNTLITAVVQTTGLVLFASLAGYAFARMRFPGRDLVFLVFLSSLMIPEEVRLVPSFVIVKFLPCPVPIDTICNPRGGWFDTFTVMTVPFMAGAFSVFLLRQFFLTIPNDLWEACELDGGGHWSYLWRVVLPLSGPAVLTVALFGFLGSWNAFLWPLIMTNNPEIRPLQVALSIFRSQEYGTNYPLLMAAATFSIAPVLVLFFFVQRQFIEGIARSGIRG